MIKQFLKRLLQGAGYQLIKNSTVQETSFKNMSDEFVELYNQCAPYTMTTTERMYALYNGIRYIVANNIPGDIVECGVWKGGSSMLAALTLKEMGVLDRKLYLYDTFSGMPEPTDKDKELFTGGDAMNKWKAQKKENINEWCYASIAEVKENMHSIGYPEENIVLVKGRVEETIPNKIPDQIALLRLDTDFYESTKYELTHLYPKLSKHGALIIDDYGFWAGAKEATDNYLKNNSIKLLLHRIDETGRIAVKLG